MKTIDEVIELFDNGCIRPCVECPCYGMKECQEQLAAESYYLHEYQKIEEENAENVPLTWDELKKMEGKPVWYEHKFWKGWIILGKVEQGVNCEMIPDREEKWYIVKDGSAKAYRRERK